MTKSVVLKIEELTLGEAVQPRAKIDANLVGSYRDDMDRGDSFPPIMVISDGKANWVVDGHHRVKARMAAGYDHVECTITKGTEADARWMCLASNRGHGLRRSNEDISRSVLLALSYRPDTSDSMVAEHLGISPTTVGKYRHRLSIGGKSTARTGLDGRKIETKNIGAKPKPKPEPQTPPQPEMEWGWDDEEGQTQSEPVPSPDQDIPDDVATMLVDTWAKDHVDALKAILSDVKIKSEADAPQVGALVWSNFYGHMQNAIQALASEIPYRACPYCKARPAQRKSCQGCGGRGWVGRAAWSFAPAELKG